MEHNRRKPISVLPVVDDKGIIRGLTPPRQNNEPGLMIRLIRACNYGYNKPDLQKLAACAGCRRSSDRQWALV